MDAITVKIMELLSKLRENKPGLYPFGVFEFNGLFRELTIFEGEEVVRKYADEKLRYLTGYEIYSSLTEGVERLEQLVEVTA